MADVAKLRVLCLHGYRQDAAAFKSKLGGFRKSTKSLLDLVFIDAPHPIENGVYGEVDNEGGGRAWWFSSEKTFSSKEYTDTCRGFEESVKAIEEAFKEQGPFDGILGFSQGAAMTAMILSLQSLKRIECSFKFGVLVAGFRSRSSAHDYLFAQEGAIDVPTLHVVGETDNIIPKAQATEILPFFVSPSVLYHPGGHFLPTSSECKAEYNAFLKKMASAHNGVTL
ncbi:esterase OVCA2 [Rhipicephalus sanguineus]|uniref:esterase OVCA2 n=1 Tax=Rhipicephalus sanguineus TaxID=34632 RepID=UPI00189592AA|nr:esterase OVCA2 [Rhipicephalus sanguineus]